MRASIPQCHSLFLDLLFTSLRSVFEVLVPQRLVYFLEQVFAVLVLLNFEFRLKCTVYVNDIVVVALGRFTNALYSKFIGDIVRARNEKGGSLEVGRIQYF